MTGVRLESEKPGVPFFSIMMQPIGGWMRMVGCVGSAACESDGTKGE